jgi:hypothetical protein
VRQQIRSHGKHKRMWLRYWFNCEKYPHYVWWRTNCKRNRVNQPILRKKLTISMYNRFI